MKGILILAALLIMDVASARKPAVEDFVGIDPEQNPTPTPQGTEALFNFSKEINDHKPGQELSPNKVVLRNPAQMNSHSAQTQNSSTSTFPWTEVVGLLTLLGLPLVSFQLIRTKSDEKLAEVKNLSDYKTKDSKNDKKAA